MLKRFVRRINSINFLLLVPPLLNWFFKIHLMFIMCVGIEWILHSVIHQFDKPTVPLQGFWEVRTLTLATTLLVVLSGHESTQFWLLRPRKLIRWRQNIQSWTYVWYKLLLTWIFVIEFQFNHYWIMKWFSNDRTHVGTCYCLEDFCNETLTWYLPDNPAFKMAQFKDMLVHISYKGRKENKWKTLSYDYKS